MDVAECRLVAGVAEWLFGEVLLDVRFKPADQRSSSFGRSEIVVNPADQRSSSIRPVIYRSVAELMAGMLWLMACHGELLGNKLAMLANR